MMYVIRAEAVATALKRLREQSIHPLFAGYLHLQQLAAEKKKLRNLRPDFLGFYKRYFFVDDHPVGTPYIRPFTDSKPSQKNLWMNPNVAGTYAPSSLRPEKPFRQVVIEVSKKEGYTLDDNHPALALRHLLDGSRIPIAELVLFLYRDFGFISEPPTIDTLIDCFVVEFGYTRRSKGFQTLFDLEGRGSWNAIAEPFDGADVSRQVIAGLPMTMEQIRSLSSEALLGHPKHTEGGPPLLELRISGLLSFNERVDFKFGRLNILVGPNGSGKSNLLDCLRILSTCPHDIQSVFTGGSAGGFEEWTFRDWDDDAGVPTIRAVIQIPQIDRPILHEIGFGEPVHSRPRLEEAITDAADPDRTTPYFTGSYRSTPQFRGKRRTIHEYDPYQSVVAQIRDVGQYPEITRLADMYLSFRIYSEWTFGRNSKLREAPPAGRSDRRLSEIMDDLPIALDAMKNTPPHERLRQLLRELKETYRDFATRHLFGRVGLELNEDPFETAVPASRLSDGTLRFLALAAILLQAEYFPLVCLEEPELGMHPDAIRILAEMLVDAAPKTQLIISTHSEHLLTSLQDDFDCLFAFDAGVSGSVVRRFTQEQFHKWREEHSLGELWTSGELGGNRW